MAIYYTVSGTPVEAITLVQAKQQLRIDHDFEDLIITDQITEARELAEDYTKRLFSERDLVIETDNFITNVEVEYSPITSITSIQYLPAAGGALVALPAANYKLKRINKYQSEILYIDTEAVPDLPALADNAAAVVITTKAGYGSAILPGSIKAAMKLLISYLYENRDDTADEKQRASQTILRPFKRWV